VHKFFPANYGQKRDIPKNPVFHMSVKTLAEARLLDYMPRSRMEDKGNSVLRFFKFCIGRENEIPKTHRYEIDRSIDWEDDPDDDEDDYTVVNRGYVD
jgi:hypothetical protein